MKRKWWLAIVITIVAIGTAPSLVLRVFHGDLVRIAQREINKKVEAKVTFSDLDVSLWRHFPRLSIRFRDVLVISNEFPDDTLLRVEKASFGVETYEYLRHGNINLARVHIVKPVVNALINYEGRSNFAILKASNDSIPDSTAGKFKVNLKKIQIDNGSFRFRDQLDETKTRITGLNFTGNGNLSDEVFELTAVMNAESMSLFVAGNPYFKKKKVDLSFLCKVDRLQNKYHIENSKVVVNNFPLALQGDIKVDEGKYGFDLTFDSPGSTLKELLSLMRFFEKDMEGINTNGDTSFSGFVKGNYVPGTDSIPTFHAQLKITDGSFRMKSLKDSIHDVNLGLVVSNSAGVIDSTDFKIDTILFRMNDHEVKGHAHILKLANSIVDAQLEGTLSVQELLGVYPIAGLNAAGLFKFNIKASGHYSDLSAKSKLPQFDFNISIADGKLRYDSLTDSLSNVAFNARGYSPQGGWQHARVSVDHLKMNIGANPIEGNFTVTNLATPDIDASLIAKIQIEDVLRVFPIDSIEMKGLLALTTTIKGRYDPSKDIFPNVDAQLGIKDGYFRTLHYDHPLEGIQLMAMLKNEGGKLESTSLDIERFRFKIAEEKFFIKGNVTNFKSFVYDLFVRGNIDLEKLTKIYPIEGHQLAGKLFANVELKGNADDLRAGKYKRTKAEGTIKLKNVQISGESLPKPVLISKAFFHLSPQKIILDTMDVKAGRSTMSITGDMDHYYSFFGKKKKLTTANLVVVADTLDLNEWKDSFTTTDRTASLSVESNHISAWQVPVNVDFRFMSDLKCVKYEDMTLTSMQGEILMKDGEMTMNETGFNSLNAKFTANGTYNSKDIDHPLFDFSFNIDKLDIQKAYKNMQLLRELLPAAEDAAGVFSVDYHLKGELDSSMYPRMPSLTGGGAMRIAEAKINGMKVFETLSRAAKRKELNDPRLRDFSMTTEIHDNRVFVKPFKVNVSGFNAEIEGVNEIEGDRMEYTIRVQLLPFDKAKIPFSISGTYDNPKITLGKGHKLPEETGGN